MKVTVIPGAAIVTSGFHQHHVPRLEDELRAGGLKPTFIVRSDVSTTTQALVGAGVGAAVVPRLAVDMNDPATASVELGGLLAPWRLALFWHRERSRVPAVAGFCQVAREVCGELNATHDPDKPRAG